MKRALVAAAVLALAACNRASSPPATATPAPAESPVASAVATQAATDASALDQSKGLPAWTFEGFPGWIGYATNTEGSREDSPKHPTHAIAIGDEPAWAEKKPALRATIAGFTGVVTYAAFEEVEFGCDGRTASFAFWSAPKRLPPGPVWLTPPGTESSAMPVLEIPKEKIPTAIATTGEKELRAWNVPNEDYVFVARRTDKTLVSEVWERGARIFRDEQTYTPMAGADEIAPGLEGGPLVPIPRLLVRVEDKALLLVESNGFEGAGFVGVLLEKGGAKRAEGRPYSYWCAF